MNYFQKDKDINYNLIPLKVLFIITILLVIFSFINAITDNKKTSIVQKKKITRIYSLKSNTNLYGGFILTLTVNILFLYTGSWKEILSTKSTLLRSENFGLIILIILVCIPNVFTFYGILKSLGIYFKTPKNRYFEQLPNKCL